MDHRKDPALELVAETATITDPQLADLGLDVRRDQLFERIVASAWPPEIARARRSAVLRTPRRAALSLAGAIAVVVAVVLAIVAQTAVSPTKAQAAGVTFTRHGGYVDATIDDPSAPADSMEAAFAKAGLDISVGVIPSSPSLAGSITFLDTPSSFQPIYGAEGSCLLPGGGTRCVIGMRVPADFSGTASIQVNGTPPAGQLYNSVNDAFAPGESLHCSGIRGMKVSEAAPVLQKLGVTPVWRTNDSTDNVDGVDESTIENEYVQDALPRSEGTAYVEIGQDPPPASSYYESLNAGC